MGDYGVKIAKPGKSVNSTNIDDYILWSKYPPLTFLEKKSVDIVVGTSCDLSDPVIEEVAHDYGFFPLVIGTVQKTAGNPTTRLNQRYLMPSEQFTRIHCDFGSPEVVTFDYKVKLDKIEISYNVKCIIPQFGYDCPLSSQTFQVDLDFYMWELGSAWPV